MTWVIAILGLGLLMIVHEAGHFFAARSFGLRVLKFSIGFGPTFFKIEPEDGHYYLNTVGGRIRAKLWKHDPEKHGPTVFQVAMIPFFAYVQVAGMNPLEDIEEDDKGSYANASLLARVVTIVAGPLANYVSASLFFFLPAYLDGVDPLPEDRFVRPLPEQPALVAGMKEGDEIVEVAGTRVHTWEEMRKKIGSSEEGATIAVVVRRGSEEVTLDIQPVDKDGPKIGVTRLPRKVDLGTAAKHALVEPWDWVKKHLSNLKDLFAGKEEVKVGGPVAMVSTFEAAAESGWVQFFQLLGIISTVLAVFNLLPVPALDGGRLMFLGYEAATRRRANPTTEMQIHALGFVVLFAVMIYVTIANDILGR